MNRKHALVGAISVMTITTSGAADFDFRFDNVFSTNANAYVIAITNMQKRSEGTIKYYCPINNNQDASVTYRFDVCTPITNAYVSADLYAVNFGSSYGRGSLWGSTNGTAWQLILDMPTPSFDASAVFRTNMPATLLGSKSVWLQARLYTVGWNITAQFLRTGASPTNFVFAADLLKPAIGLHKAVLAHFDNLEVGQDYTVESSSDMTNWSFISAFTATNSSMNHTQFWLIGESPELTTFYRVNTCTPPSAPEAW